MPFLHILFLISHLSLVITQYCDSSDTFGCNATDIDDEQATCGNILNCAGGFPASSDCVNEWCDNNCADPDNCCYLDNPKSCFQSLSTSSDFAQCTYIAAHVSSCASATPGFTTLSVTDQVSCFCFDQNRTYNGYTWDDAATTCYAALSSQTTWATSDLNDYFDYYLGACTKFVDTSTLSNTGTGSRGGSATATPAGSSSLSDPTTATGTSTPPPTTTAPSATPGTPSSATTASSKSSGAGKGLEGCGTILGAFLIICCIFASL